MTPRSHFRPFQSPRSCAAMRTLTAELTLPMRSGCFPIYSSEALTLTVMVPMMPTTTESTTLLIPFSSSTISSSMALCQVHHSRIAVSLQISNRSIAWPIPAVTNQRTNAPESFGVRFQEKRGLAHASPLNFFLDFSVIKGSPCLHLKG